MARVGFFIKGAVYMLLGAMTLRAARCGNRISSTSTAAAAIAQGDYIGDALPRASTAKAGTR